VEEEAVGPLKLVPQAIARPWGGGFLAERYGKPLPPDGAPLGESWEASDLEGHVSVVATGPHAGQPIDKVLGRPLPLLLKLLHVNERLSLQVHPDEQAAEEIGRDARPKTEAWHILWTDPGAYIYYGAKQGVSTDRLLEACASGDEAQVEAVVNKFPVSVGDTIMVPAGTVHGIGPGVVAYEIQQPSDTTYRLFDWGRVGLDGKPRALHFNEAQVAIRGPTRSDPRRETELVPGANPRIMLCRSPGFFRLDLLLVDLGELIISESRHVTFFTCMGGRGWVRSDAGEDVVSPGDTFCVPPDTDYMVKPGPRGLRLLHARIPKT
jgi:mannose-6-phosphate isomerase